ncbi:hypothetical protein BDZ85DRAFT_128404 [Elsinoe ampelina]|uniref:Uncharacterized protein n=1 Tax=Elsinoe ampelina TaxID=302913 RepID=A0A6A6G9P4_9PEZI|nr:hypothetical protein BDZ85DRAFT_128404 [Elsinoe ampelina]
MMSSVNPSSWVIPVDFFELLIRTTAYIPLLRAWPTARVCLVRKGLSPELIAMIEKEGMASELCRNFWEKTTSCYRGVCKVEHHSEIMTSLEPETPIDILFSGGALDPRMVRNDVASSVPGPPGQAEIKERQLIITRHNQQRDRTFREVAATSGHTQVHDAITKVLRCRFGLDMIVINSQMDPILYNYFLGSPPTSWGPNAVSFPYYPICFLSNRPHPNGYIPTSVARSFPQGGPLVPCPDNIRGRFELAMKELGLKIWIHPALVTGNYKPWDHQPAGLLAFPRIPTFAMLRHVLPVPQWYKDHVKSQCEDIHKKIKERTEHLEKAPLPWAVLW